MSELVANALRGLLFIAMMVGIGWIGWTCGAFLHAALGANPNDKEDEAWFGFRITGAALLVIFALVVVSVTWFGGATTIGLAVLVIFLIWLGGLG